MNHQGKRPLWVIDSTCVQFMPLFKNTLSDAGLWAFQSFDLRSARALHEGCTCPHHDSDQCTCELLVLLVYRVVGAPITLFLDGRDGQTFIFVVDEPANPVRSSIMESIEHAVQRAAQIFQNSQSYVNAE